MQERNHRGKADGKQMPKRRNVLAKKIGDMISNACGSSRRKAQQRCIYKSEKPKKCMEEKDRPSSLELNKSTSCGENQASKVHARHSRQKGSQRKSKKQSCKAAKQRMNVSLSLSGIFRRSSGFRISKWRGINTGHANADGTKGLGLKPIYGRIKRAKLRIKREEIRDEKTKKKHNEKECEAEEVIGELELCKKRILMGEKCRPLNISGALHYDNEGILLPEDFLPSEEP